MIATLRNRERRTEERTGRLWRGNREEVTLEREKTEIEKEKAEKEEQNGLREGEGEEW